MIKFIVFGLLLASCPVFGQIKQNNKDFQNFLNILGKVESNNNDYAVGDGGRAISRYQIWKVCYLDAKEYNKSINFSYESLTNSNNAAIVVKSYLNRYCPKACKENNWEIMARTFNGGPNGANKSSTIKYWERFKKLSVNNSVY